MWDTRFGIRDAGYEMPDTGYEIRGVRYEMLDTGNEILDTRWEIPVKSWRIYSRWADSRGPRYTGMEAF